MHLIYRKEDATRVTNGAMFSYQDNEDEGRSLGQNALYMLSMIGILVFINWAPAGGTMPVWDFIYQSKYIITAIFAAALVFMLIRWFQRSELTEWVTATRGFAVQILPLLFGG